MIGSDYSILSESGYSASSGEAALGLLPRERPKANEAAHDDRTQSGAPDELSPFRKPWERVKNTTESDPTSDKQDATRSEASDAVDDQELTEEERKQIEALKKRHEEVRRHEEAHFRAGGSYASSPNYVYQTGPDGKRYAVGGSVNIDTSVVPDDPRATLEKARVIKRAALAPEEPSSQDRKVARQADQMAAEATREMAAPPAETRTDAPAPNNDPHDVDAATTDETAATSSSEPASQLDMEAASTQQSLIQYRTSRLEHFYVPVASRLNEDAKRIPLHGLFDRFA